MSDPYILDFMNDTTKSKAHRGYVSLLSGHLSGLRVSQLSSPLIADLRDHFLETYKPSYVSNIVSYLIQVRHHADLRDLSTPSKPLGRGLRPKVHHRTRYLLDDEEERLLRLLEPLDTKSFRPDIVRLRQNQYDLVVFLIDTGCRYSEATKTPWDAVDTKDFAHVTLYRTKVNNEGRIALTNRMQSVLKRRYASRGNALYVWPSSEDPEKPRTYSVKGIANAIARAGLNRPHLVERYGRFTTHSFRHTFASRLVQAGMSLYSVSVLLGHSDVQMTKRYAHLAPDRDAIEAAQILNDLRPLSDQRGLYDSTQ